MKRRKPIWLRKLLWRIGIKPKKRSWTIDLGNGQKAYFVNRPMRNIKRFVSFLETRLPEVLNHDREKNI